MKTVHAFITQLSGNDPSTERLFRLIDQYYYYGYIGQRRTVTVTKGPTIYKGTTVHVSIPHIANIHKRIDAVRRASLQVLADVYLGRTTPTTYPESTIRRLECQMFRMCEVIEIPKKRIWFETGDQVLEGHIVRVEDESLVISSNGSLYTVHQDSIYGETRDEYAVA